jgi:hypothetical protein
MRKTDVPFGIDDTIQGHAAEFEELDLLAIDPGNRMIWIGQSDERNSLLLPILFESRGNVGTNSNNHGAMARELFIFISQARQLRAAVRSHKAAQE